MRQHANAAALVPRGVSDGAHLFERAKGRARTARQDDDDKVEGKAPTPPRDKAKKKPEK